MGGRDAGDKWPGAEHKSAAVSEGEAAMVAECGPRAGANAGARGGRMADGKHSEEARRGVGKWGAAAPGGARYGAIVPSLPTMAAPLLPAIATAATLRSARHLAGPLPWTNILAPGLFISLSQTSAPRSSLLETSPLR